MILLLKMPLIMAKRLKKEQIPIDKESVGISGE